MKVRFCVDNGANIHSCRSETFDLKETFDITDEEWKNMSEDDKFELADQWGQQHIEIYWEECT